MADYTSLISEAVKHFWQVRNQQSRKQGSSTGKKDYGSRAAVTGGKHLDGFVELLATILRDSGLEKSTIHTRSTTLPGYFRPTKDWDLVVVDNNQLLAVIEFKAQVGSFGNNFNNRVEEALGNSLDILTAYREGKFRPSQKPWLGWFMLLEDSPKSTSQVKLRKPHFEVFSDFHETSYAQRYELFCERLMRERLYDSTCFLMSNSEAGLKGEYSEPNDELSFKRFATSLKAHALAYCELNQS